jgi:CarboxypepD_reg-like domain/TonB-dependent Receptor Plug Domain
MKRIILLCIIVINAVFCQAQSTKAVIKGFVTDKANGEPIISALIRIEDKNLSTQTDVNGFFSFPKLNAGKYILIVNYNNFEEQQITIELAEGDIIAKRIELVKRKNSIAGVKVIAKKQEKMLDTKVGVNKISVKEIKALPSIGGEPDIAQYLQVLPGITFTGDQGGQLYIRGGSPIQNKILLDGMTIYNPFHSIGLFSVFETEGIRNADVMSGGFGVEYGDRTSAIVNVNTKDGNKVKTSGKIGVSPILAKLFIEGPLLKQKSPEAPSITYIASIKNSYLDKSSKAYRFLGSPYDQGLPFSFNDVYGKICINSGSSGKLNFFGFNFDDKVDYANSNFRWNNYGLGGNFVLSPNSSSSLVTGGLNYNNYKISLNEADGKPRQSAINGFDGNIAITAYLPNNQELKYGFEVAGFQTVYEYFNALGFKSDQNENTTQLGGYIKYKANVQNKLIVDGGFRFQYYASLNQFSPEPRIAAKYNFSKNFRIKAAVGRYSQNLISTKNDKDIVNLFTGFLTGPEVDLYKVNSGKTDNRNIQFANHFIGGIEYDINNLEFTLEPWFKDFTQLIGFNRYKLTNADADYLVESGKAYGLDLTGKYSRDKFYFWGTFSLGNISRYDGRQTYPPPFDRRVNINLLSTYTFGKNADWEASVRFNFGSAFPFTLTQSLYENISFGAQGLNTNYLTQNGTLDVIYDNKINNGRLSDYHRLDASIKKKITIKQGNIIEATLGATNMYNRNNIFYINRITNTKQFQLPFFPTLAIGWNF